MRKKIKQFIEDIRNYGEGELKIEFSIWHIVIIAILIVLVIWTF